jgi:hypothetical protein
MGGGSRARSFALTHRQRNFFRLSEGKSGLSSLRLQGLPARAVISQPPRYFIAPLVLSWIFDWRRASGDAWETGIEFAGNFTKGTSSGPGKQKSAAMWADSCHWSVLRCGEFQWRNARDDSTALCGSVRGDEMRVSLNRQPLSIHSDK